MYILGRISKIPSLINQEESKNPNIATVLLVQWWWWTPSLGKDWKNFDSKARLQSSDQEQMITSINLIKL